MPHEPSQDLPAASACQSVSSGEYSKQTAFPLLMFFWYVGASCRNSHFPFHQETRFLSDTLCLKLGSAHFESLFIHLQSMILYIELNHYRFLSCPFQFIVHCHLLIQGYVKLLMAS
jgi:hypothetical protein